MLDKRAEHMTKGERLQAARDEFRQVDEYTPSAATAALASRWNISNGEAANIVGETARMIAEMRRQDKKMSVKGLGCHYCGQPAINRDFFGAPVCGECG